MLDLHYRPGACNIDSLNVGECTIRPCRTADGAAWWELWMRVTRTDGQPDTFAVPVLPGEGPRDPGETPRMWGFNQIDPSIWLVGPSINVLVTRDLHPGQHPVTESIWHEVVRVVGVPDGEPWIGHPTPGVRAP